jgi:type II secretory pathway component PulL
MFMILGQKIIVVCVRTILTPIETKWIVHPIEEGVIKWCSKWDVCYCDSVVECQRVLQLEEEDWQLRNTSSTRVQSAVKRRKRRRRKVKKVRRNFV